MKQTKGLLITIIVAGFFEDFIPTDCAWDC